MKSYNRKTLILVFDFAIKACLALYYTTIVHINTLMNLFTRWLVLGFVFIYSGFVFAQTCPQVSLQLPDTVCSGQTINYPALPQGLNYAWDVCSNDMVAAPAISFKVTGQTGSGAGAIMVEDSGRYYVFFINSTSATISRASYGTNFNATPTIVNLGNFGGQLANPAGLSVLKDGENWFAFVASRTGSRIVRLSFGSSITNVSPEVSQVDPPSGIILTGCNSLTVKKSNDNYYIFVVGGLSNRLFVLNLGNSLANSPITGYNALITGSVSANDIDVEENCGYWFGLISDFSGNRIHKVDFGNNLDNPTPTFANVTAFVSPGAAPNGITIVRNKGQFYGIVASNAGIAQLINLRSGLLGAQISTVSISGLLSGNLATGANHFYLPDGQVLITGMVANRIIHMVFSAPCAASVPASFQSNPTIQYTQAGKYYVSLIVTNQELLSQHILDSIVVKSQQSSQPTPLLNILADEACVGSATRLNAVVAGNPGVSFNWTFHDNTTASGASVTKTYAAPGLYNVRLRVRTSDRCGTFELNKPVRIYTRPSSPPVSNFTFPAQVCAFDSVQFTDASTWATGTIVRWRWTVAGVPGTNNSRNPKLFFSTPGTFQVTLVASDSSGCGNPVTRSVTVNPGANVNFTATSACARSSVSFSDITTFQGGTTFASRLWNFGSSGQGNTSTLANPTFTFADSGTYQVRLTVSNSAGCSSSFTRPLRVYARPILRIGIPTLPFVNQPLTFQNLSILPSQTIDTIRWQFPFVQGQNQVFFVQNPTYTFPNSGNFPLRLRIRTDRGCVSDSTFQVGIIGSCPVVTATAPPSISTGETATFTPNSVGASTLEWDFCAGDLFEQPTAQNVILGTATSFVQPVFDGTNWFGFVPADQNTNSGNSLFRLSFGNDLNNDPGISQLGNPQNAFNRQTQMRVMQENGIWYGLGVSSITNSLSRLRFGTALDSFPTAQTITLPAGTLSTPSCIRVFRDRDTTIAFIVNNNNSINNNIIRLVFRRSILDTPTVTVFSNPPNIQNSNGFFSLDFRKECNEWFGVMVGASQVYKMSFGISLTRAPQFSLITDQVTNFLPVSESLANLRGVNLVSDLGQTIAFINNSTGNFYRVVFGNGLVNNASSAQSLGNFGIVNNLIQPTFINQGSEWFAFSMDANARTLNRIKFPNRCDASPSFIATNLVSQPQTIRFGRSGRQLITTKALNNFGWNLTTVDSILVNDLPETHAPICTQAVIDMPEEACFNQNFRVKSATPGLNNVSWDFCEGDLLQPLVTNPVFANPANAFGAANGYEILELDGNFYGFLVHSGNSFVRFDYGNDLLNNPILVNITGFPTGFFGGAQEIKIRKQDGNWIGIIVNGATDNLGRINFGPDLLNTTPTYSVLNGGLGFNNPRGMALIFNGANYYALVVNRGNRNLMVLDFGKSLLSSPTIYTYPISVFSGVNKIAMIQHCNVWYALATDQTNNAVYRLEFKNGLYKTPELTGTFSVPTPIAIELARDKSGYVAFVGTEAGGNSGLMFRLNFGSNIGSNQVNATNLGNFGGQLTSSTISASSLIKTSRSEYQLHLVGFNNRNLIRFDFTNRCSATPGTSTADSVLVSYATPGTYFVSLSASDSLGRQVQTLDSVQIRNPVEARFGFAGNRCRNLPITFLDSTLINSPNPPSYSWNFGDPGSGNQNTSSIRFPVHTFAASGTYTVALSVAEASGCTSVVSRTVRILNKPSPDFSFSVGSGCSNDSIQFTDVTLPGLDQIVSWEWNFGSIGTSNLRNPKFAFPTAGIFNVRLKVIGLSGCDSSISKTVNINRQGPSVSIGLLSGSFCLGDTLQYGGNISNPAGTTLDSLVWNLGNAVVSRQQNPLMFYPATGTYRVTLTAYNNQGCVTRVERNFRVYAKPTASLLVNQTLVCMRNPLIFSPQNIVSEGAVVSQLWNFGDGTTDTSQIATKSFQQDGRYLVSLQLTSQYGCTGNDTSTVEVKRGPIAEFDFSTACLSRPVNFINRSSANGIPGGIIGYSWDFGNGQTFLGLDPPPIVFNNSGDYPVRLTVTTTAECPNTITKILSIGNLLSANFTFEQGCLGTPYLFRDISVPAGSRDSVVSWSWTIGGQRFNIKNPRAIFDFVGEYSVALTVATGNGCESSVTATNVVQVGPPAVAAFDILNTTFAAPPFVVGIRNQSSNAILYKWDFGDSTTSSASNPPSHTYRREGVYIISLTAYKNNLCSTMISKVVNVILNPVRGVRVRVVSAAERDGLLTFGAEVENESNVELREIDFRGELNDQTVLNEKWIGSLLPGGLLTYTFKSQIAINRPGSIDFVCVNASLPDTAKDITPENNRGCFSLSGSFKMFDLFPNPAQNELNTSYVLDREGKLTIEIVDALGRRVWLLEDGVKPAGVYQPQYAIKLKPGFYTVRATFEGTKEIRRLVVKP